MSTSCLSFGLYALAPEIVPEAKSERENTDDVRVRSEGAEHGHNVGAQSVGA